MKFTRSKKYLEELALFCAGNADQYGQSLVSQCIVGGKYVRLLGIGGQSVVLLVENLLTARLEALLLPQPHLSEESLTRLFRSVKTLSLLHQKYPEKRLPFPRVFSASHAPPFIVEEYIKGISLYDYIVSQPALSLKDRLFLIYKLGHGLQEIHTAGIVHRDIKPQNVIIDENGLPWWLDFGMAKSYYDNPVTRENTLLGTIKYAAPEQIQSAATITPAADIYSFGKMLYFIITGTDDDFAPEKLDNEFLMIFACSTDLDPKNRYSSIVELLSQLFSYFPEINFDPQETTPIPVVNSSIAKQFIDLNILFGGQLGKVKRLLNVSNEEWEHLMFLAKKHTLES